MKFLSHLAFFCLIVAGAFAQKTNFQPVKTYRNPVIAGDFADPSVIRVGDTYYAAGTSSEWAPAYPIYSSKNLVDWEYVGPVFSEIPSWTMGSFWAPELFYRNGTYYVYYTARRKSDKQSFIGVASTKDLKKGFTDHGLLLEWTKEAIDAFVVEDGGKLYLTWKAYGLDKGRGIEILGAELSADGLKVTGKEFGLIKADPSGWESGGAEGQAIFKKGKYWYMLYSGNACCGDRCNYQVGVARAENLRGPWTKFSGNPILVSDDAWKCPGHGTVVTTPDNRYFYLHHAYNGADFTFAGRQGILSELVWNESTQWPVFRYGKTSPAQAEAPLAAAIPVNQNLSVDFSTKENQDFWVWDVSLPKLESTVENGVLKIKNSNHLPAGNFLGLVIKKGNFDFTTDVIVQENITQNITVYGDAANAVGFGVRKNKIELWQLKDNKYEVLENLDLPEKHKEVTLRLHSRFGRYYEFSWTGKGEKGSSATPLKVEGSWLPRWDRAPRVGISVSGNVDGKGEIKAVEMKYE